jgi:hypothetical protein
MNAQELGNLTGKILIAITIVLFVWKFFTKKK